MKPLVRILLAAGFAVSGYLLWLRLSGQTSPLVGCGAGSGCSDVLGSRWSAVFGVPVSGLAAATYLGLLFTEKPSHRTFGGVVLILAAAWFIFLQAAVVRSFCPWCLAAHAIGIAAGSALLLRNFRPGKPVLAAGLGVAALALAQIFGPVPDTHEIAPASAQEKSYLLGQLSIVPSDLPHLGDPEAEHMLVEYFDYTCNSCRDLHGDIKVLLGKSGGAVGVVCMPSPLEKACNQKLRTGIPEHVHACALARLSLAAWRARPEKWPAVHELLFARPVMEPSVARAAVVGLVGELDESDPWITSQIEANTEILYALSSEKIVMPKLLLGGDTIMHGLARDPETFVRAIRDHLGIGGVPE